MVYTKTPVMVTAGWVAATSEMVISHVSRSCFGRSPFSRCLLGPAHCPPARVNMMLLERSGPYTLARLSKRLPTSERRA